MKNIFATRWGIIVVGAVIGVLAATLQKLGNPGNMGVCVACFIRDISGSLGLHRAAVVQYLRPEIFGFVIGSFAASLIFKEFRPRAGSAPVVRFILGFCAMVGALVFLGCPWRALLRLAGGDGNALFGILGLIVGVGVGTLFFKTGYNLGRSRPANLTAGLSVHVLVIGLLLLGFLFPPIAGADKNDILLYSVNGPGSMYAPLAISLAVGLAIGFIAQRSRFCTMGAFRDFILFRHTHLLLGVLALLVAAFITNQLLGQFHPGFQSQPVAHTMSFWNFAGMGLAGLAFALAGGCPGRQLFLAGEGDGDAALFAIGMAAGAAFSHNFGLASSPQGVGPHGIAAVLIGFLVCMAIGFGMRKNEG